MIFYWTLERWNIFELRLAPRRFVGGWAAIKRASHAKTTKRRRKTTARQSLGEKSLRNEISFQITFIDLSWDSTLKSNRKPSRKIDFFSFPFSAMSFYVSPLLLFLCSDVSSRCPLRQKKKQGKYAGVAKAKHIFYVANGIVLCTCYVFVFCSVERRESEGKRPEEDKATQIAFKIALTENRNRWQAGNFDWSKCKR